MINVDLIIEIPPYFTIAYRIVLRLRLSIRESIDVASGVIDADYRGKIKVILVNQSNVFYRVEIGQKIAQLIFEKIEMPTFVEVTELSATRRIDSVFGSSGKKVVLVNMFF